MAAVAAAAALVAGIAVFALPAPDNVEAKPALGLFTSLPIYWAESESIAETLSGAAAPHWARTALEAENRLLPLDTLDGGELGGLSRLFIAQPRPLTPSENVALDGWVRSGGRLLLFADPMLTEDSRFAIGDKRRPQDLVMLSTILRRWGLELRFDESQQSEERSVPFAGGVLPVELPGTWSIIKAGAPARCTVEGGGVIGHCSIGGGRAVVIADAAVIESDGEDGVSADALQRLVTAAFSD